MAQYIYGTNFRSQRRCSTLKDIPYIYTKLDQRPHKSRRNRNRLPKNDEIRKTFQQTCIENEKVGCFDFYLFENQKGHKDNAKLIAQLNPQAYKNGRAMHAARDLPDRPPDRWLQ